MFGVEGDENGALTLSDLKERLLSIEPTAPIDLGKPRSAARFRRPLDFEEVARQFRRVAVSCYCPDVQNLAAGLPECTEILLISAHADIEPRLFFKFTPRAREFIFACSYESFRHGPGPGVVPGPIRPSGVDEKHLRAGIPSSK